MDEREKAVLARLAGLGIAYKRHEHPPAATVEEAEKYWGGVRGVHCKNLFLRNWKGDRHYLLVAAASTAVDLKKLGAELQEGRLSFASPERLRRSLGLEPGSVSPFGLINDPGKNVRVIIDAGLRSAEGLAFHPNVNTATLEIATSDFIKFLEACGHAVLWYEF